MQTIKDHLAGFVMRGKKWNIQKKQYEEAAFLNIYVYQTDDKGDPKQAGIKKLSNGQEVPNYNIAKVYRIPLSTLSRVVAGEGKRCQMFWSELKRN